MICMFAPTEDLPYEKVILEARLCKFFKMKLYHKDYLFGRDTNTTFYVSLYDFKTPFWLQVRFNLSFTENWTSAFTD